MEEVKREKKWASDHDITLLFSGHFKSFLESGRVKQTKQEHTTLTIKMGHVSKNSLLSYCAILITVTT